MRFNNAYFITGTAYAGKSTMTKLLAEKYDGILCEENYHDQLLPELDSTEFPFLTYTRDLEDWHDFIRRTPEEYKAWMDGVSHECEILELRILDGLKEQRNALTSEIKEIRGKRFTAVQIIERAEKIHEDVARETAAKRQEREVYVRKRGQNIR